MSRHATLPKDRYIATCWMPGQMLGKPRPQATMHVFGPYTVNQAYYERKKLLAEPHPTPGRLEISVCRPIDVGAMNAPDNKEETKMPNLTKVAVHTRTKTAFAAKAVELIKAGKAKTSYPRIVADAGIKVASLHAMLSPVTELKGGWTVIDRRDVTKLDDFLKAGGTLLAIVDKGAKDPKDLA